MHQYHCSSTNPHIHTADIIHLLCIYMIYACKLAQDCMQRYTRTVHKYNTQVQYICAYPKSCDIGASNTSMIPEAVGYKHDMNMLGIWIPRNSRNKTANDISSTYYESLQYIQCQHQYILLLTPIHTHQHI